jgi:hypothetical protein
MNNYAIIENESNIVINVCVWDEVSTWAPPENTYVVKIEDQENACIGGLYLPDQTPRFTESSNG